MSALRAMRSAVRPAFRSTMALRMSPHANTAMRSWAELQMPRYFAADPGFLDRDSVSARVLEVVRKFEKVWIHCYNMLLVGFAFLRIMSEGVTIFR